MRATVCSQDPSASIDTYVGAVASIDVFERPVRLHKEHSEHKVRHVELRDVGTRHLHDRAEHAGV